MKPRMKPTTFFRQCVGIDVAKESFVACLSMLDHEGCSTSPVEFSNRKQGFNQLVRWARKEALKGYPIYFLMEPTGVYHESLALHLSKLGFTVYVVPGQRVKNFAIYEGYKTKTDRIDAYVLSMLGCQNRNLKQWSAPNIHFISIRNLCRFRASLITQVTRLKNQSEALANGAIGTAEAGKHCKKAIDALTKNIKSIDREVAQLIDSCPELKDLVELAITIPGIGLITAVNILCETGCFESFSSQRQLTSFAGLDVVAHQSGSCDPKRHISKKGNSYIRASLYMSALSAIKDCDRMRQFYLRIKGNNPNGKVAIVAVMRKQLNLVYTLCKQRVKYNPDLG